MYVFDDSSKFVKVLALDVPWVHTYADMRPGKTDLERRENYRNAAESVIRQVPSNVLWWAFRITVSKVGRPVDVDNVAKTIVDSFSRSQIERDGSRFSKLVLYDDDNFDHVRVLQVIGNRSLTSDSTRIEVFARVRE